MQSQGTLIWDFDGTLATREFGWDSACLSVLEPLDGNEFISRESVIEQFSGGFPWHLPEDELVERVDRELWWARMEAFFVGVFTRLGFANHAEKLARAVHQMAIRHDDYRLLPDAVPTLQQCAEKGWHQVILSNHMPDLPDMVRGLGLDSYIFETFTSANLGFSKPNPAIFRKVLATLPSQDNVWMIGDSYEADIRGAQSVGISAILVRSLKGQHSMEAADLTDATRFFGRLS